MLVDSNLAIVGRTIREEIPFVHPDPQNPEIDPETGQPRATDYIQHSARAVEDLWSEAEQAAIGVYRLHDDPRPTGLVIATERREFRTVDGVQRAYRAWDVTPMPATDRLVNAERDRRLIAGAPITLSGGRTFTMQTRDDRDLGNITGRESKAQRLNQRSDPGPIRVRDADNVIHDLTPDEVIDMAEQVHDHQERLYFAGYAVKGQVEAGTLTDATEIEAAFDAALAAL